MNNAAVSRHLAGSGTSDILLVCAGTFREAALEDILAAGMLISRLPGYAQSDAAQLALALYRQEEHDLRGALARAKNGRALIKKGRQSEVDWCAQSSIQSLVAAMTAEGFVRPLPAT